MSDVYIFVGPTLSLVHAREHLDAHYLPPVARGDVYRAARKKPWAIGIIDGYFSQAPAVWHKEILWAMAQGIHVFGAASMGALRAAELEPYGMRGVGRIFEAFRDGVYEDDDEVTVIHGPAESGYLLVSEPIVNIRATLQRACEEQVIGADLEQRLVSVAKALHYPDRNYSKVLAGAQQSGDDGGLVRLRNWLPKHKVNQKRLDAIAMLDVMRELQERGAEPLQVSFRFERTDAWEEMVRQCAEPSSASSEAELSTELILDELRLLGGPVLRSALLGALARHLAVERARAHGATATRELFSETLNSFFAERGLREPAQIKAWLEEHELDSAGLTRFMQQQSYVRWAMVMLGGELERQLRDHLRSTPDYLRVVRRANAKHSALSEIASSIVQNAHELPVEQLVTWFFESRLQEAVPRDLDACAWERGFSDRHALVEALRREYYFVTTSTVTQPAATQPAMSARDGLG